MMTDAEIDQAIGSINENYPIWQAILAMLQRDIESATSDVSVPGLSDNVRQYEAGRLAHALEVNAGFQERMREVKARAAQGS